jgi:gliding motility-associated-like protein
MQSDSVTYNNRIEHDFNYISEQSVAVVSPILGCPGEVVELEASGGLTYLWYQADDNGGDLEGGSTVSVELGTQEFYFVLIKQAFCQFQDSIIIDFSACRSANAFSPNNDAINDFLFIEGLSAGDNNSVTIFNRWGDEVNYYPGYDNEDIVWRGENVSGGDLPEGTYYIVVTFNGTASPFTFWAQMVR